MSNHILEFQSFFKLFAPFCIGQISVYMLMSTMYVKIKTFFFQKLFKRGRIPCLAGIPLSCRCGCTTRCPRAPISSRKAYSSEPSDAAPTRTRNSYSEPRQNPAYPGAGTPT